MDKEIKLLVHDSAVIKYFCQEIKLFLCSEKFSQ